MAKDPTMASKSSGSLEARIVQALERSPKVMIPPDFATRVASRLPSRRAVSLRERPFGFLACVVCLALLIALMTAFGHQGTRSLPYVLSIESVLAMQYGALLVWLTARRAGYTLPGRSWPDRHD